MMDGSLRLELQKQLGALVDKDLRKKAAQLYEEDYAKRILAFEKQSSRLGLRGRLPSFHSYEIKLNSQQKKILSTLRICVNQEATAMQVSQLADMNYSSVASHLSYLTKIHLVEKVRKIPTVIKNGKRGGSRYCWIYRELPIE